MYFLFNNLGALESELISIERCESFMNLEPEHGYIQYLKNREELKSKSKERRLMKGGWPDKGKIEFEELVEKPATQLLFGSTIPTPNWLESIFFI